MIDGPVTLAGVISLVREREELRDQEEILEAQLDRAEAQVRLQREAFAYLSTFVERKAERFEIPTGRWETFLRLCAESGITIVDRDGAVTKVDGVRDAALAEAAEVAAGVAVEQETAAAAKTLLAAELHAMEAAVARTIEQRIRARRGRR